MSSALARVQWLLHTNAIVYSHEFYEILTIFFALSFSLPQTKWHPRSPVYRRRDATVHWLLGRRRFRPGWLPEPRRLSFTTNSQRIFEGGQSCR